MPPPTHHPLQVGEHSSQYGSPLEAAHREASTTADPLVAAGSSLGSPLEAAHREASTNAPVGAHPAQAFSLRQQDQRRKRESRSPAKASPSAGSSKRIALSRVWPQLRLRAAHSSRTVSQEQQYRFDSYQFHPLQPGELEACECHSLDALEDEFRDALQASEVCEVLVGFDDIDDPQSTDVSDWHPARIDELEGELNFVFEDGYVQCKDIFEREQPVLMLFASGDFRESEQFLAKGPKILVGTNVLILEQEKSPPRFHVADVLSYHVEAGYALSFGSAGRNINCNLLALPFVCIGTDMAAKDAPPGRSTRVVEDDSESEERNGDS